MNGAASVVKILAIILIICISLVTESVRQHVNATGQLQSVPQIINFSKYENSKFGMSVDYPSLWKIVEDNIGAWFKNTNESVNVRLENLPIQNRTMDEVTSSQLNLTRNQFPGQVILESNVTTIGNNYPAYKIVFTFPEDPADLTGTWFKELKAWTIWRDKAYVISFFTTNSSYNNYLSQVTKIIDSFRISQTSN
jgi:hypothetical protein